MKKIRKFKKGIIIGLKSAYVILGVSVILSLKEASLNRVNRIEGQV